MGKREITPVERVLASNRNRSLFNLKWSVAFGDKVLSCGNTSRVTIESFETSVYRMPASYTLQNIFGWPRELFRGFNFLNSISIICSFNFYYLFFPRYPRIWFSKSVMTGIAIRALLYDKTCHCLQTQWIGALSPFSKQNDVIKEHSSVTTRVAGPVGGESGTEGRKMRDERVFIYANGRNTTFANKYG